MLTDEQGRRITPGAQIGARGGEGCVFEVMGSPNLVAKLYHEAPDARRIEKLRIQCASSHGALREIAAWPQSLLHQDGRPAGFVMTRVQGRPVHELYRPMDRLLHFPGVTWQHLVAVSRNVAAAFCTLHENGVLMADVNESNVLITPQGEVRLIDCDSFQLTDARGMVHACEVGTAMWTAPELQGVLLTGASRTTQHDLFGLAVLIFHLLFMGRHPFAGVPRTAGMPPDLMENIRRRQFAYSRRAVVDCLAPPHVIPLAALPPQLADLFEQAFLGTSRPSAARWRDELEAMRFYKCRWGHCFSREINDCPWCAICDGGGPSFFIAVSHVSIAAGVPAEMTRLSTEIEAALPPAFISATGVTFSVNCVTMVVPTLESLELAEISVPGAQPQIVIQPGHFIGGGVILASAAAWFWAPEAFVAWMLCAIAGWVLLPPLRRAPLHNSLMLAGRRRFDQLQMQIEQLLEIMRRDAADHARDFAQLRDRHAIEQRNLLTHVRPHFDKERARIKAELHQVMHRFQNLPRNAGTLTRRRREELQLADHLRGFHVAGQRIPQIGPARSQMLVQLGIETAWDVKHMRYLDNLGRGYTELRKWVSDIEARFCFDPRKALSATANTELQRMARHEEQALWRSFQMLQVQWRILVQDFSAAGVQKRHSDLVQHQATQMDALNHHAEQRAADSRNRLDHLVGEFNQTAAALSTRWSR